MKRLMLVFVLVLSTALPSQVDTTFSELRGIDDSSGVTHLFYRKHTYLDSYPYSIEHNDFYHLNLDTQSDTLKFKDYFYNTYINFGGPTTNDFEFWDNDPHKYIFCGAYIEIEPVPYISRFDSSNVFYENFGEIFNVEISHQNDSLLYFSIFGILFKSFDGGFTWNIDSTAAQSYELVTISPFNDQILFTANGYLYKSTDNGKSYGLVDSSVVWWDFGSNQLFFDADSLHIYGFTFSYGNYYFLRSADAGNSWALFNSSSNKMYLSVDPSQSGEVFFSEGNEIKISDNYGITFNPYWQLNHPVVGLYKKPNSDILYAATTKDIYEITPKDTVSIKHLSTISLSINNNIQPVVQEFKLYQNYPNPFNPTTTIRFDLPKAAHVRIEVFNIRGQRVAILLDERREWGYQSVEFDAGQLASGIYFYRIVTENYADVKKMILMR